LKPPPQDLAEAEADAGAARRDVAIDAAIDTAIVEALVETHSRMHLGFIDLNGNLGRRFGSLGLSIDAFPLRVRARMAAKAAFEGPQAERAAPIVATLLERLAIPRPVHLEVLDAIPAHAGLGSGTQLALACGRAISDLHGRDVSTRTLASWLQRGARSGIGIGTFDEGGFVVDGGRVPDGPPPPIISRLPFPDRWRIVLLLDPQLQGVHGSAETHAFARLPAFPPELAAELSRLVLMQLLPGLASARIDEFGPALTQLQRVVGDHFAPHQGGRYASPRVAGCLELLRAMGAHAVGQTSWGPTGFAIAEGDEAASALLHRLRGHPDHPAQGLDLRVVGACNRGAVRTLTLADGRRVRPPSNRTPDRGS